ncbi:MAG: hypothetical protein KJO07_06170, partial [Deltaproteobacteria bacterium]|nr:hypothetical protein [Deltaproteobacteria bacterium]
PEVEALIEKRRASGLKPRVTPAVGTLIVLDNEASSDYSVVEVFTKDVPGVLHSITRCLADLGLDIHLAKIGAEGERVADAFYVADGRAIAERLGNGKLTPERFAKVREALEDALVEDQEDE